MLPRPTPAVASPHAARVGGSLARLVGVRRWGWLWSETVFQFFPSCCASTSGSYS
ncbi:MAG: hypothetical protein RMI04_09540 [Thermofilaceae archaeon]|nr:hypothetical protein [Thermofilaceae archaeon]